MANLQAAVRAFATEDTRPSHVTASVNRLLCRNIAVGKFVTFAYAIAGRGLGASGAFASAAAGVVHAVAPARGAANGYFSRYLQPGVSPWSDWLVLELAGVPNASAKILGSGNKINNTKATIAALKKLKLAKKQEKAPAEAAA